MDLYPQRNPLHPANRLSFYLSASRAFLGHLKVAQAALELDAIDVIIGYAILHAGVDHLDQPGGDGRRYARLDTPPPDESRRPISVSALARSLSLSRETVRRRSDHLFERAIVSRDERGLRVTTAFLTTPTYQTIVFSQMEPILGFLLKLGYPDEPEMGDARAWLDQQAMLDRARQFSRIMLRVQLRHYETLARLGGDLHSGLLLSLILSNAEGEVGQDGATSRLQLAEALALNRESTRRRLVALARSGSVVRTTAGYRPSSDLLSGAKLEGALADTSLNIRQMVRLLAVHGFVHEPHPAAGVAGRIAD